MTPYQINILLHYHTSPGEPPDSSILSPIIGLFVEDELLKYVRSIKGKEYVYTLELTTRGRIYIERLLKTEPPKYTEEG